jgi:hypothetical protein
LHKLCMTNVTNNIYGLFELDTAGTVKYSKFVDGGAFLNPPSDLVGRNFFDDFAPFRNVEELRRRFRYFAKGSDRAQKFNLSCQVNGTPTEVKVMLTQISEREFDASEKLIIVDIRKL